MTLAGWLGVFVPIIAGFVFWWIRRGDKETSRKLGRSEAENEGREHIDDLRRRFDRADRMRDPKPDD